jgi:hypothetical protein
MSAQHPITPPDELLEHWCAVGKSGNWQNALALAYRAGADQEMEATLGLMETLNIRGVDYIRSARRPKPKPPSLKEQALEAWEIANQSWTTISDKEVAIIIRRALEALPND